MYKNSGIYVEFYQVVTGQHFVFIKSPIAYLSEHIYRKYKCNIQTKYIFNT